MGTLYRLDRLIAQGKVKRGMIVRHQGVCYVASRDMMDLSLTAYWIQAGGSERGHWWLPIAECVEIIGQ